MRALRRCAYWLMLFPLLGLTSGDPTGVPQKNSDPVGCTIYIKLSPTNECTITTNRCSVDPKQPDWVLVHKNESVTWERDSTDNPINIYRIIFSSGSPFVASGDPGGVYVDTPQTVTNYTCKHGVSTGDGACDFKYDLYQKFDKCADPGVRVVPPSIFSLWYFYLALAGVLSYAVYRIFGIRARKRMLLSR
jgi:hypothetical protein